MTLEKLLAAIQKGNQRLKPYHVAYCKQMLQNDNNYWEKDNLGQARFIYLTYFSGEYDLNFEFLDADVDEVYKEEELSFSEFLEEADSDLADEYQGFIPRKIAKDHLEELVDASMEIDQLMASHLNEVFKEIDPDLIKLPIVYKEDDSEIFIAVDTGKAYDHVELKILSFYKLSKEKLLTALRDKLEAIQFSFVHFVNDTFTNKGESIWLKEKMPEAKAILIRIDYSSGTILLDFTDNSGKTFEKKSIMDYMGYLEKKHSFTYRSLGVHFPFEVFEYVQSNRNTDTELFKQEITEWVIHGFNQSKSITKGIPCFIQEFFEESYLEIKERKVLDKAEWLSIIG